MRDHPHARACRRVFHSVRTCAKRSALCPAVGLRSRHAGAPRCVPPCRRPCATVALLRLQIRQKRLDSARKILGLALGKAPKQKLFKFYIDLETQLGQVDRVRTLYGRFLEWNPTLVTAWGAFADLEIALEETERARRIYELALTQPALDMPEKLWKAYIDFEIEAGERGRARALYEALLEKTQHVKVRGAAGRDTGHAPGYMRGSSWELAGGALLRAVLHRSSVLLWLKQALRPWNSAAPSGSGERTTPSPSHTCAPNTTRVVHPRGIAFPHRHCP